ncbi:MAG: ABC transporter permease [Ruthenibacterium sp.]
MIRSRLKSSVFWFSNLFYIMAVLFILAFGIINPKFLNVANLANIFAQSSVLIILSIGMALALITKGMDMSVGAILFLCATTMQVLNKRLGLGMVEMITISLVVGTLAGLINGIVVSVLKVYPLLPTLATMFMYRGLALLIGGGSATMPMFWSKIIGVRVGPLPVHVLLAVGLAVVVQILLSNTKTGRYIYALGDSEKTAAEKGINANRIKILVYTVSGFLCGVAAVIFSAQSMSVPPSAGDGLEFKCVIAATLGGVSMFGGKGTVAPGVMIGSLIMSVISNVLVVSAASAYIYTVVYALVILFVVLLETLKIKKIAKA